MFCGANTNVLGNDGQRLLCSVTSVPPPLKQKRKPDPDQVREAARLLSQLGASKGGRARAKSMTAEERRESASKAGKARLKTLTAEQRKEIARKAIAARWAKRTKR